MMTSTHHWGPHYVVFSTTLLPRPLYTLTYFMEQRSSWEANRFSATQIPRILWNPKVYYRIHKCLCKRFVIWYFLRRGVISTSPKPNLEDHSLSAVRECLFNIFAAILHTGGRSSVRSLRTRHAMVTGTHISRRPLCMCVRTHTHTHTHTHTYIYIYGLLIFSEHYVTETCTIRVLPHTHTHTHTHSTYWQYKKTVMLVTNEENFVLEPAVWHSVFGYMSNGVSGKSTASIFRNKPHSDFK